MSTELYLPPVHSPEYKKAADAAKMDYARKFVTKEGRKRGYLAQGKPVDVFDSNGHYLATYPSYKTAAAAHGTFGSIISRVINRHDKSANGFMFRRARARKRDIKPLPPRDYTKMWAARPRYPYHRSCLVTHPDGTTNIYPTTIAAAEAIGCSAATIWRMNKCNSAFRGITVKYINEK